MADIVKVKYIIDKETNKLSYQEYSYFSEMPLSVGDEVEVPVRDSVARAQVTAVNVPEADIAAFKDKVKTIPRPKENKEVFESEADYQKFQYEQEKAWEQEQQAKASEDAAAQADIEAAEQAITTGDEVGQAVINIDPGRDQAIATFLDEILRAKEYADKRLVASQQDAQDATSDLSLIAKLKKAVEDKRKEYLQPLAEYQKRIREKFDLLLLPLNQADSITRKKILDYRHEQERKRLEAEAIEREKLELAKREAELNQGEITVDLTPIEKPEEQPKHIRTDFGTAGEITIKKWEIVNFAEVPDEYKVIDAGKVTKLVKAGIGAIPGIRIYEEKSLRVNSR